MEFVRQTAFEGHERGLDPAGYQGLVVELLDRPEDVLVPGIAHHDDPHLSWLDRLDMVDGV